MIKIRFNKMIRLKIISLYKIKSLLPQIIYNVTKFFKVLWIKIILKYHKILEKHTRKRNNKSMNKGKIEKELGN